MSLKQTLLVVVVPLVLGVVGNLLTTFLKHFAANVSRTYRSRRARKAEERQRLIGSFVARPELATQYLLIYWVSCAAIGVMLVVIMTGALMTREIGEGGGGTTIRFTALATIVSFWLFALFRRLEDIYRGYLEATGAPSVAIKSLMGDHKVDSL